GSGCEVGGARGARHCGVHDTCVTPPRGVSGLRREATVAADRQLPALARSHRRVNRSGPAPCGISRTGRTAPCRHSCADCRDRHGICPSVEQVWPIFAAHVCLPICTTGHLATACGWLCLVRFGRMYCVASSSTEPASP